VRIVFLTHFSLNSVEWKSNKIIIESATESMAKYSKTIKNLEIDDIELIKLDKFESFANVYFVLYTSKIPTSFLDQLNKYDRNFESRLVIPIFGNLTSRFSHWPRIFDKLKNHKIHFLFSSQSSLEQGRKILGRIKSSLCFYPLSSNYTKSEKWIKSKEVIKFCYVGRCNTAKGFFQTLKAFRKACSLDNNIKLYIAGEFDRWCYQLHGMTDDENKYFEFCFKYKKILGDKIIFLDYLSQKELKNLLRQCHGFISPSTFHDEDFGIACAQALSQGCIPLLTDWGGYKYYNKHFNTYELKISKTSENIPKMNINELVKGIVQFSFDQKLAGSNSEIAKAKFSGNEFVLNIMNVCKEDNFLSFLGPSKLYELYLEKRKADLAIFQNGKNTDLYFELYSSYY
tara:strand:+ start:35804 stop:37000 length:1197 start_codon:yes stop_codon:yes gene_type:complete